MTDEIWKVIPEFNDYEVSNLGNIRSLDRVKKINSSNQFNQFQFEIKLKGINLKKQIDKDGYYYVKLRKNSQQHKFFIHQLVMITFVGKPDTDQQVRHLDGNNINNNLNNLKYGTAKENANDRELHGHTLRGSQTFQSKIDEELAVIIKKNIKSKCLKRKEFCEKYNVSVNIYKDIQRNKTWKHIEVYE